MEEEDEVAVAFSTTWNSVEGCLERSVCIAREKDEVGTAGSTSRLVLVPPSGESGPCELKVTFQRRLCHVLRIDVQSTARTVEIYGQLEQDSEAEYVSTMRGELVLPPENEIFKTESGDAERRFIGSSERASGENDACQYASSASSEETESKLIQEDDQKGTTHRVETGELVGDWKDQLLTSNGSSWGGSGDSRGESFQSLSDSVPGKMVDGSIVFDEPLDETDWVECPHSPMKSSTLSSDDEVDIKKCGFFLVDSDGDKHAGQHASNGLSTGIGEAAVEKDAACISRGGSTSEQELAQSQVSEERTQPPKASSTQVVNTCADQSGKLIEPRIVPDVESSGNRCGIPYHNDEKASRRDYFTAAEYSAGEIPVYKAEMNLACSKAWSSVKIRFLSLKDKSKFMMQKVIISVTPGPSDAPMTKSAGPLGSFQQSAGSSSLLAMLGPGIFQMARGLADSRKFDSLGVLSCERKFSESRVSPSRDLKSASLSVLGSGLPSPQPTPSSTIPLAGSVDQKECNFPLGEEKAASFLTKESCSRVCQSLQHEPCRAEMNLGKESCVPIISNEELPFEFDPSEMVESNDVKSVQSQKVEDVGCGKDLDISHEVVQRLDRLEAICLRMENSLNFSLESMDRRLKLLEEGGVRRMPVTGQPFWGADYDSGPLFSATSVNLPPEQTGMKTGPVLDKQADIFSSTPVDSPAGQLPNKGVASGTDPFFPGHSCSTSPSLLSSTLPALPLWPLSSPKHVSPEFHCRASSTTTSIHSKDFSVDQLISSRLGQAVPIRAEETYWEAQTSDDTESDMSSDSEHTSYADNSEEPDRSCCLESLSSSPSKPAQQVENALASALSAFSAAFDTAVVNSPKRKDLFQVEDEDTMEDSFTSEEQAPLVDCFSLGPEEESVQAKTEEVFMQGYEAIPVSAEKVFCDMSVGELKQEHPLSASEVEGPDKGSQIDWENGMLQSQDEKMCYPCEDSNERVANNLKNHESNPDLLDPSSVLCLEDLTTYDLFPMDFERILREEPRAESRDGEAAGAYENDKLPNPFLQLAFAGDVDLLTQEDSWCEDWNDKKLENEDNVTVAYMTVRGFFKPLDPLKEMQLQEEMFPEDWNWFTSEVPSSADDGHLPESLLGNGYLKPVASVATVLDTSKGENGMPGLSVVSNEPRSLLDEDIMPVGVSNQFRVDVYAKDWAGQKTQWSLLDEDPPIVASGDGRPDDLLRQREQRSLLDEDIFIPSRNITADERHGSFSSCVSPEEQYDLSGVIRPPKCTDTLRSPSSHASSSNPFEDNCNQESDLKVESQNLPTRDLLEDFDEEPQEFEAPESERTQSLLFHLSL